MSTSNYTSWMSLIYGLSAVVTLGLQIVLLVVIANVVRRHRPDAYKSLLAWALTSLAVWLFSTLFSTVGSAIAGRSGVDAMFTLQIVNAAIGIPLHVVTMLLLVRGLVRLAQPPKPVTVESNLPYR
jgi:uncharacterized membrane protein YidH (DUF202 family)